MSVQVLDLAHNVKGFETKVIQDLKAYLEGTHTLDVNVKSIHLSTDSSRHDAVEDGTRVVIVVCHGAPTQSNVLTTGNVTHFVGDFVLDTPVQGEDTLSHLLPELRAQTIESLKDPNLLPSFVAFPDVTYAVIWFVCDSNTADAPLFSQKKCFASLAFYGKAFASDVGLVGDMASLFHTSATGGRIPSLDEIQDIRNRWPTDRAGVVLRNGNSFLIC